MNQLNMMDEHLQYKLDRKLSKREDLKSYETYYKLKFDDNGYFLNYSKNETRINETIKTFGFFVIITSQKMTAEETLNIYRDRDAVEKVFRMEKSYLGFDAFRVQSNIKLESKLFISFIALIIRNEIYQKNKTIKYN